MKDTTQLVDVYLGHPLVHAAEKQYLGRLRRDLEARGIRARILANIQVGRDARQVDFLIVTDVRAALVELKTAGGDPIMGSINGRWERLVGGRAVPFPGDGNPYRQCHETGYALGDTMRDFAHTTGAPAPPNGRFISKIDLVVCLFPAIPANSQIDRHQHVRSLGYDDLLTRLEQPGRRPDWDDEQWNAFVRHLQLYREEEDTDAGRSARLDQTTVDEYCARFAAERVRALPPLVETGVSLDGAAADRPDVTAYVLAGQDVMLIGDAGYGKTLWAAHTAGALADQGHPAVWLEARAYDGDFSTFLARSVAPYTTRSARDLLGAARRAGRVVTVVIDGLNECPDPLRRSLLAGVQALQLRDPTLSVLATARESTPLGADHAVRVIELSALSPDERRSVLEAYGAGDFDRDVTGFTSPLELSLAAACADQLPARPTRATLFDTYIAKLHPTASARGGLRLIAERMHDELRLSLPAPDVARSLRRALGLDDSEIDTVLGPPLVRTRYGRVMFAHERFADFLAAEALIVRAADGGIVPRTLNEPRASHLRRDAVALESDERRLVEMLSEIHDAPLLAAAACGELGQLAEDVGMGVLVEVLRVATAHVLSPGVTFTPAEQWFGDSWQGPWRVSEADTCQLTAAGMCVTRGRLAAEVGQLLDATDSVCASWEAEHRASGRTFPSTYVFNRADNGLPTAAVTQAIHHSFGRNTSEAAALDLLAVEGTAGRGRLYVACQLLRYALPSAASRPRILPLIAAGLAEGVYHLWLEALQLAQFRGRELDGDDLEALRSLVREAWTENLILNSVVAETLAALGDLDSGRDLGDVLSDIRDVLARPGDRVAWSQAEGAINAIFEDSTLVGPYFEAIQQLDQGDRERLFAMALWSFDSDDLGASWVLGQLENLDLPELRSAVVGFAERIDPGAWHGPQHGMESALRMISLLARSGVPRPRGANSTAEAEGWEAFLDLIESVVKDAPAAELQARCRALMTEHRPLVADLLFQLRQAQLVDTSGDLMTRVEQGVADAFGSEFVTVLVWSLDHLDQLTSVVRFVQPADRTRYLIRRLGECGNGSTSRVLRRFADDPTVGAAAAEAVRQIESRSNAA